MTYAAYEQGQGSPVECYRFLRGATAWYLTSHDEDVLLGATTYTSVNSLRRSGIEWQQKIERTELTIEVPRNESLVEGFIQYPPTEVMTVTIFRTHLDDPDQEVATIWQGRVLNTEWSGSTATMTCEPVFTSLKRPGLRRKMGAQCPHSLYGAQCNANSDTFRVFGTITSSIANVVTATAFAGHPDGYFVGGYLALGSQRRAIVDHVGNALTLNASLSGAPLGQVASAFPGCKHILSDCINKFSNVANYGGFPYVPGKNPFGGTILF